MPGKKDKKKYVALLDLIEYNRFAEMDPNDPLVRALSQQRPYSSSDTIPMTMIPDLQKLR